MALYPLDHSASRSGGSSHGSPIYITASPCALPERNIQKEEKKNREG